MPLFPVSCVCDEGVREGWIVVVEAADRPAVAAAILKNSAWQRFLDRAYRTGYAAGFGATAEGLLERIENTRVDGDSLYQLAILPVPPVGPVEELEALPKFAWAK